MDRVGDMSSDFLSVAALGQPYMLGMLYDARRGTPVPGSILWDDRTVRARTEELPQPFTNFRVTTSDSSQSKTSLLDVDASLKASFLSGLVEVSGSAKYLNDQKKFQNQSRVTFQYSSTTKVKQLTTTGSLDPQQVGAVQKGYATHVVTKILYGANAFFLFDSEKLDSSSVQQVSGSMEAVINKIPSFTLSGKVEIKLDEEEKALVQKFSCKFHGDFVLKSNPATFVDAVKTYAELPTLLGDQGQNTVPVKVWLMPLRNLVPEAPPLLRDLSGGLVRRLEEVLEDLKQMEIRCNDSLADGVAEDFPQIQEDLRRFQKLCGYYRSDLQKTTETKLPLIRQGTEDESALRQVFEDRDASPFSQSQLLTWLQSKEREINVLRSCVDIMNGVKIVHSQSELDREVLSPGVYHVLCFVFTSLESADPCLDKMTRYLDSSQSRTGGDVPWYYSDQVLTQMRQKARTFYDLFNKRKTDKKLLFLVAAVQNPSYTGASLYHYKDGILNTDNYSGSDFPPEGFMSGLWALPDVTEGMGSSTRTLLGEAAAPPLLS